MTYSHVTEYYTRRIQLESEFHERKRTVSISMHVHATLHTSEVKVYPESDMTSGAIQYGLPTTVTKNNMIPLNRGYSSNTHFKWWFVIQLDST